MYELPEEIVLELRTEAENQLRFLVTNEGIYYAIATAQSNTASIFRSGLRGGEMELIATIPVAEKCSDDSKCLYFCDFDEDSVYYKKIIPETATGQMEQDPVGLYRLEKATGEKMLLYESTYDKIFADPHQEIFLCSPVIIDMAEGTLTNFKTGASIRIS